MSFLFTAASDPAPECFLATADNLVQTVMQKYRAVRREDALDVPLEDKLERKAVA
jgi:hypothetical protein